MGKGRIFGSVATLALAVIAASWSGCGSSNDQGISFRSLGFFAESTGTTGDLGRCASLQDDTTVPNDTNGDGTLDGGFLGIENNMVQGVNLDHVDLTYHVNGSRIAIPNDVAAIAGRVGPASGQEPGNASRMFAQILIVTPNIFKFLNDNSSRLPDPPFSMVITAVAVGTTDSGDVVRTNRSNYEVSFVAQSGGCGKPTPTPGESLAGTGTGTGQ